MANVRHPMEQDNYFFPPHGGRPPSDEAVREATERYRRAEAEGKLDVPVSWPTHTRY